MHIRISQEDFITGTNRCYVVPPTEEEATIKVASTKHSTPKPNGIIKLKKAGPKQTKPGNWKEASIADGNISTPYPISA